MSGYLSETDLLLLSLLYAIRPPLLCSSRLIMAGSTTIHHHQTLPAQRKEVPSDSDAGTASFGLPHVHLRKGMMLFGEQTAGEQGNPNF